MERPAKIVERYIISADGTKVFAGALGDPTKPALVFVHGFSLCSSIFNDLFARSENSKGYYLIRFDMRGHGRTGKPDTVEGYSSKKHAEDYAAVVKAFNGKRPILVGWSWGGTIAGDVASYLPPGSMLGAVYIASHPTLPTTISSFLTSVFLPVWNSLTDDNAAANAFPIAFNRLCFARDPHGHANYLSETLELNDGGADFVPENPAASYEIRLATMGMMATMKPLHRRLVVQHLNDDKILELLASGFPVLEVIGSHDSFLHCDIDIDAFKPIARNLDIHIIEGASHAPFIDAPDEVMGAIIKFANKVHLLSGSAQL